MSSTIAVQIDAQGVGRLTLNRPEKHNALSAEMMAALVEGARTLASSDARVVVMDAAGPTFCAGGDLAWMRAQMGMDAKTRKAESRRIADALSALADLPQPLIGQVQGNAFGGGVGLCAVCDVVIAAEGARFGLTETRLGLIPANIGPYVVARMGGRHAREVFMSARIFDAQDAVRLGLVNKVVDADVLNASVKAEVAPYLSVAPGAVREAKKLLRDLLGRIDERTIDDAIDALAARWDTDEAKEGIAAFFDKRPPSWSQGS